MTRSGATPGHGPRQTPAQSGARAAFRAGSTGAVGAVAGAGTGAAKAAAAAVGAARRVAVAKEAVGHRAVVGVGTLLGLPASLAAPGTVEQPGPGRRRWQQLHLDEPRRPSRNIPMRTTNVEQYTGVCDGKQRQLTERQFFCCCPSSERALARTGSGLKQNNKTNKNGVVSKGAPVAPWRGSAARLTKILSTE